jgi:hypothetical protein
MGPVLHFRTIRLIAKSYLRTKPRAEESKCRFNRMSEREVVELPWAAREGWCGSRGHPPLELVGFLHKRLYLVGHGRAPLVGSGEGLHHRGLRWAGLSLHFHPGSGRGGCGCESAGRGGWGLLRLEHQQQRGEHHLHSRERSKWSFLSVAGDTPAGRADTPPAQSTASSGGCLA